MNRTTAQVFLNKERLRNGNKKKRRKIKILRELSKIHIMKSWRETVSFWRASWVFH